MRYVVHLHPVKSTGSRVTQSVHASWTTLPLTFSMMERMPRACRTCFQRKGHGVVETVTADLEPQSESAALPQAVTTGNVLGTDNPLHGLGECVVEVSVAAYPLSAPLPPPAIPKFSLRICMCGKTLTGKSEQAIRLGDRYCLKVRFARKRRRSASFRCMGFPRQA